ncbi:MAG: helix-turn-helix transcriptional regulator [Clostridia bacterium]|nr:helix-turn-helix transcriptional regulator [Clostridia bacterium]
MIAERIKTLRETAGITQAELARRLGVTRSGVNAWEMGISVPSTQCLVELALLFKVSTDYLLGIPITKTVSVEGLSDEEIASIVRVIECYKKRGNGC